MEKDFKKRLKEQAEKKKIKKSELIAVRLPMDIYDSIKTLCDETGGKQSQVIIMALRDYLGLSKK